MPEKKTKSFLFFIFQAVVTPLQGFFNTIVYGWSRRSFRHATRDSLTPTHDLYIPTPEFTSAYYDHVPDFPTDYEESETDLASRPPSSQQADVHQSELLPY